MRLRWNPFHAPAATQRCEAAPRFSRSPDVTSARHGDRVVLLDLRSEAFFALDDVGARIWEHLAYATTVEQVATELAAEYEAPRRAGFVRCFATVAGVRASLRLLGFRRTVRIARWLTEGSPTRPDALDPTGSARAIAVAAAFFPGRAVCLEQSLALFVVLRRGGSPATLRLGVQPYPFQAHAWVEVAGRPLLEHEDAFRKFVPFPEAFA